MTSEIILAGFVKVLGEEQTISASLTKRELVISTEEQYPQHKIALTIETEFV